MKKTVCLLLVISLFIGFSACKAQEVPNETTSFNNNEAPRMLLAFSPEGLETLLQSSQLSDAEFDEFVKQNIGTSANGVGVDPYTKKQEVENLVQILSAVGMPVVDSNVKLDHFILEYRPESLWINLSYRINGAKYRFAYYPHQEPFGVVDRTGQKQVGTWSIGEKSIALYVSRSHFVGELYINGYSIYLQLSPNSNANTIDSSDMLDIQNLFPAKLTWIHVAGEV